MWKTTISVDTDQATLHRLLPTQLGTNRSLSKHLEQLAARVVNDLPNR